MTSASAPTYPGVPRLLAILSRAATLRERLEGDIETYGDGPLARTRMERWSLVLASGDPARFRRRLEWDGLSLPDALSALGEPRSVDGSAPAWLKLLAVVLSQVSSADEVQPLADLQGAQPPIPFEDVLRPFVAVAAAQLYARVHPALGGLGSGGRLGLERALLARLSQVCGPALYRAFDLRRATATSPLERLVALGLATSDGYRAFVREIFAGGLEQLFVEQPVLARLAATLALDWVDWSAEFMLRLAQDRPELSLAFAEGADPGSVTAVTSGLSDPHDGGRSVLRVAFASGLELAYKPRDVGLEKGYQELVGWLNGQGLELPLRAPNVLQRQGYGWVEWIAPRPALDAQSARRYFRRAGMLMALFYGLGSTDCHQHNLVAVGDHPLLVDAETLLHPRVLPHGSAAEVAGARTAGRRWMEESVFEADFLPAWTVAGDGRRIDISGLGGVEPQRSVLLTQSWERVNSDAMRLTHVYEELAAPANALRLEGGTALPWDFPEEIAGGFAAAHRLLEDRRDQLLAPGGPLDRLRDAEVRLIVRPTAVYQKLLDTCTRPALLAEGAERGIELELLARPLLAAETEDPLWPLHRYEQAALVRMDIPRFGVAAGSRSLNVGADAVQGLLAASALEHAAERLSRFDATDCERQTALIKLALEVRSNRAGPGNGPSSRGIAPPPVERDASAERQPAAEVADEELMDAALALAERLERTAIAAPDGGLAWIGLSYDERASRSSLRPIGLDLYSGQGGVTVFFAGLDSVTGENRFRNLALAALRPLLSALREGPDRVAEEVGIGGATGLGSIVYALVTCAGLLKEPALLAAAESAARAVSAPRIEADRELDVVAGSAGALLGLLSLQVATGSEVALQQAMLCGEHLLARRTTTPSGFRAWASHSEEPLAGFAHGAAGTAYSLLLGSLACRRPDFGDAAEEAIRYEATLFDPAERNWRDLRPAAAVRPQLSAWCHGASGIALARLGALELADSPEIRADVTAAVLTTRAVGEGSCDQVCCGAMGRAETLLVAGDRLSTPQLIAGAREIASRTLSGAPRRGPLPPGRGSRRRGLFARLLSGTLRPRLPAASPAAARAAVRPSLRGDLRKDVHHLPAELAGPPVLSRTAGPAHPHHVPPQLDRAAGDGGGGAVSGGVGPDRHHHDQRQRPGHVHPRRRPLRRPDALGGAGAISLRGRRTAGEPGPARGPAGAGTRSRRSGQRREPVQRQGPGAPGQSRPAGVRGLRDPQPGGERQSPRDRRLLSGLGRQAGEDGHEGRGRALQLQPAAVRLHAGQRRLRGSLPVERAGHDAPAPEPEPRPAVPEPGGRIADRGPPGADA